MATEYIRHKAYQTITEPVIPRYLFVNIADNDISTSRSKLFANICAQGYLGNIPQLWRLLPSLKENFLFAGQLNNANEKDRVTPARAGWLSCRISRS
jgi:hypothetical protein